MNNYMQNYLDDRPQRLCKMCGKCCRVATTSTPYEELKTLADSGDESAQEFLRVFEPYPSIEDAKKVGKDTVENIIKQLESDDNYDPSKLTFYKCKYIRDDNLCSVYLDRPELCDRFPSSPWAIVPPKCGFEGWLFQERESRKQRIRRLKENKISFEVALKTMDDLDQMKKVYEGIDKINNMIKLYEKYGSADW